MTLEEFIETFQKYERSQPVQVTKECGETLANMWITEVNVVQFQDKTFANAHLSSVGPDGCAEVIVNPDSVLEVAE